MVKGKITNDLSIVSVDFYDNGVCQIKFSDGKSMLTEYEHSDAFLIVEEEEMWVKQ